MRLPCLAPGGVTIEIAGRLNALLGERAYPNKVRGVWGKMVAESVHGITHYRGTAVFLSTASSLTHCELYILVLPLVNP